MATSYSKGLISKTFQPELIVGPAGSGKSRCLVQKAIEAAQQQGQVLLLGMTASGTKALQRDIKQVEGAGISVQPLQTFIEQQVRQVFVADIIHSLHPASANALLGRFIRETLTDELHPHYYAARQSDFQIAFMHAMLSGSVTLDDLKTHAKPNDWLFPVASGWQAALAKNQVMSTAQQLRALTRTVQQEPSLLIPASFLTSRREQEQWIFIDDAQALSLEHWELFSAWQAIQPDKRHVVMAGNPELALPQMTLSPCPSQILEYPGQTETLSAKAETLSKDAIQANVYVDSMQEVQALAYYLRNVMQAETTIFDVALQKERPLKWSDILVLTSGKTWDALLVEVFLAYGIPVSSENIPLDLREVQTAIFDTLTIFSTFDQLEAALNTPVSKLLEQAGHQRKSLLDIQDLWRQAALAFERLLTYLELHQFDPNLEQKHSESEGGFETFLQDIWQEQAGSVAMKHVLQQLVSFQSKKELSAAVRLEMVLKTVVLKDLLDKDPSSEKSLGISFWQPLQTFSAMLPDGTFGELLAQFDSLWQVAHQDILSGGYHTKDAIRLLHYHQAYGVHAPYVCLPFLTQEALPKTPGNNPLGLLQADVTPGTDDSAVFVNFGISRCEQYLWMSAHQKHMGQVAWVHPVLIQKIIQQSQELTTTVSSSASEKTRGDYESTGVWATLSKQEDNAAVLEGVGQVPISPTAVNTFLKCPRQFFYKHLLRLPENFQSAASPGLLVHRLMEMFNKKAFNPNTSLNTLPRTQDALLALKDQLFHWEEHQETLLALGFVKEDFKHLSDLNAYQRQDLELLVEDALYDLMEKGYLERLSSVSMIEAEKAVNHVVLPGLPSLAFRGKLDAVVGFTDGTYEILDYKFYGTTRFTASPETIQENWQNVLRPLETNETTGLAQYYSSDSLPVDLQMPLYYLALQQDPKYRNKLRRTTLQMIRPGFGDANEKGSTPLTLEAYDIEAAWDEHLAAGLEKFLQTPLLESEHYTPAPSQVCDYCSFATLCEAADKQGNLE